MEKRLLSAKLLVLASVFAGSTSYGMNALKEEGAFSPYPFLVEEIEGKITSISDLNDFLKSQDIHFNKTIIGFDFDDTLSKRVIVDVQNDEILDGAIFNTEILRDHRAQFKGVLDTYEIGVKPTLRGNAVYDKVLEDSYITKGVTILRNKALLAALEYQNDKNIQGKIEISKVHHLFPVEDKKTKLAIDELKANWILDVGVCSVMRPGPERNAFLDTIGIDSKKYVQGEEKLRSIAELVKKQDSPEKIETLVLVDNYSQSGEDFLHNKTYEILSSIQDRLASHVKLVSVVYAPKEKSDTKVGLMSAYFDLLSKPGVHVPFQGEDYGPNAHLLPDDYKNWEKKIIPIYIKAGIEYNKQDLS